MRWGYKTVHYELKKEGFLGSGFLDEAEVEQSLNEYGSAGWELVSMMETQDGLIAVFKQPLERPQERSTVAKIIDDEVMHQEHEDELITENDIIVEEFSDEGAHENNDEDNGLRSIRIE